MNKRMWTSAISAIALVAVGCSDSGGDTGTTTPTPDTGGGTVDAGADTVGGGDDTAAADTGGGGACSCVAVQCGYLPDCPSSCGACPEGKKCVNNMCEAGTTTGNKRKFGEYCGADATCQVPPSGASDAAFSAYRDCLDNQCEGGRCFMNVCTKPCKIYKDDKNNVTGEAGADGIEDPDAETECSDAVDGPYGKQFVCVEWLSPVQVAQGQSLQVCTAGKELKKCKADVDCTTGETCQLVFAPIYGEFDPRCMPAKKNPDNTPGAGTSQTCNNDPKGGALASCASGLCWSPGLGCVTFCKSDDDCLTDSCDAGKCKGSGATCATNSDCSAWACDKGRTVFSDVPTTFDICWPKNCELDGDCLDENFHCQISYNGVQSIEGDVDPTDPDNVKMPGWDNICLRSTDGSAKTGEACDPFPTDGVDAGKACNNPYFCSGGTGGICGALCKADTDCKNADSKCGISEYPIDLNDNDENDSEDAYLPFSTCYHLPGAGDECASMGDCDGKYCKPWTFMTELPAESTATTPEKISTSAGVCVTTDAAKNGFGGTCGPAAGGTLCNSGLCLGSDGGTQAGLCTDVCSTHEDCKDKIDLGGQEYKSVCSLIMTGWNGTYAPEDDVYYPICWVTMVDSTLTDCTATKTCSGTQVCRAYPITWGPDKAAKVEYLCVQGAVEGSPAPTGTVGDACNPDPPEGTGPQCKGAYCFLDAKPGTGYCSGLCNTDADCGGGTVCDDIVLVPRAKKEFAAVTKACRKKVSCIPCDNSDDCTGNYECTNVGTAKAPNMRCAPPCSADGDCGATDGGAKCVPAKDVKAGELASKVCQPTCG